MTNLERIVIDPKIMVGKPVVRGTRIPVKLVLKRLTEGLTLEALVEAYPRLTIEDIKACLQYSEPFMRPPTDDEQS